MNNLNFEEEQANQALVIGQATIVGAYLPTGNAAADKAYLLDALERIATLTRKLTVNFDCGTTLEQARLALGGAFCAKALAWALKTLNGLACLLDIEADEDVLEAVKRVSLARKVMVRRELELAVSSVEDVAAREGISVEEMLSRAGGLADTIREGVTGSLAAGENVGLSKDFVKRMKVRLGIE